MAGDPVLAVAERLSRLPGVHGAMVVDAEAGVPVASQVATGVEESALAALAGSLFGRAADASRTAGFGGVRVLQMEAKDGHLVVADAGPLLVVALTGSGAQLGLVRAQAVRAAEELKR